MMSIGCIGFVMMLKNVVLSSGDNLEGGFSVMAEYATEIAAALAVIGTLVTQCIFYKKDSQTMSDIKQDVTEGHNRLSDKLDGKEQKLSAEHSDIRDIVREIRLRQEQELELQKDIRNAVPDAGMIKEGIDKICWENATLREAVSNLEQQIEHLQQQNKELLKKNKQLQKRIERDRKPIEDIEI